MSRIVSALRRLGARLIPRSSASELEHLVHAIKNELVAEVNRLAAEAERLHDSTSEQFGIVSGQAQAIEDRVDAVQHTLEKIITESGFPSRPNTGRVRLEDIDVRAARFLNDCTAANGPLREAGRFVNHPLTTIWKPGGVVFEAVNERIIELPYVHRAVATLPTGSRILDIGSAESVLALELATMGFHTTALEPRGYPLSHPNLTEAAIGLEELEVDEPFDAAVLLSTIEHLGIGAYALDHRPDLDLDAMKRVWEALSPGGLLVLTTPFGEARTNDLERTYDFDRLERLLSGFVVDDVQLIRRQDATTWLLDDASLADLPDDASRVVLVTAHRGDDPNERAIGLA